MENNSILQITDVKNYVFNTEMLHNYLKVTHLTVVQQTAIEIFHKEESSGRIKCGNKKSKGTWDNHSIIVWNVTGA